MEKIKTEVNQQTIKEIYKKIRINFLLFFIISTFLLIGFIFILITIDDKITKIISIASIFFSGFLFAVSLFALISFYIVIKKSKDTVSIYEVSFNSDNLKLVIYEQEEKQIEKIYKYEQFKKYVLTTNYVVAYYKDGSVIPFNRDNNIIKILEEKGISRKKKKAKWK